MEDIKAAPRGPTPVNSLGDPDTPPTGQSGARATSQSMVSCLPSLCPMRIREAGTSVGLWAIEGKAWVRRGRTRDGFFLGEGRKWCWSAAQGWIEAR